MGDQGERYSEGEVIAMLAEIFSIKDPRLIVGIGDDTAAVAGSKLQLLTTDLAVISLIDHLALTNCTAVILGFSFYCI